jgi:hypothetical protein
VKDAPNVRWPVSPAHVGAFGPFAGRHDQGDGMPATAQPTPSADAPEEVAGDDVSGQADDQGPE